MKLIIRDEKPKEETCEIWVEQRPDGRIVAMSRLNKGLTLIEVDFFESMTARPTCNGNFKWAIDD